MEAAAFAAQSEAIVFLSYFADFPDPRQRGKVVYPLNEILLLCLLAMLAGAKNTLAIQFEQCSILRISPTLNDGGGQHSAAWSRTYCERADCRSNA